MATRGKKIQEVDIPKSLAAIGSMYTRSLRTLITQIKRGKSIRSLADKCRVSHTAMSYILKAPERTPSRKMMIKIIRATTKPRKKKVLESIGKRLWHPDAI